MARGTVLLIDGNALVHRAFHALPPLTAPTGELTNATFGFTRMLLKAIEELKPRCVVAAFDTPQPTFRKVEYEAYKAQRAPAPDGLAPQFRRVDQVLEALRIPVYRLPGYEADDVLGALARQAVAAGYEVVILTGDTDALQLVGPGVRVLMPRTGVTDTVLYDEVKVRERYGLEPKQLADLRALRGDPSDNIPSLPGVGEKTASRLLQEFGSVEELLQRVDELPGKLRATVADHAEQIRQSKRLATIVCDLPVQLDLEACEFGRYDRQRLLAIFHELGFRSLLDHLPPSVENGSAGARATDAAQLGLFEAAGPAFGVATVAPPAGPEAGPIPAPPRQRGGGTGLALDAPALAALAERLRARGAFALQVVGTNGGPMRADLVGLAFADGPDSSCYVPLGHRDGPNADRAETLAALRPLLEDPGVAKRGHDLKYGLVLLGRFGIALRGLDFDTMIAAYLLETSQRALAIRDLAWARFQVELPALATLLGSGKKAITPAELAPGVVAGVVGREAEVIERLVPLLARDLAEAGQEPLFREVELPLVPVLASMERTGVAVDVPYLQELSRELYERLAEIEAQIYAAVGHEFNLNSPAQLSTVLFKELGLPQSRRTRTGQVSTGAEVLEELRGTHEVIDLILEYRQLSKLKSTYVDALPLLVNPETGRVHTSFNQTVAATGRLSSSDPNLQNIPVRTELGRRVRRAFVAGGPDLRLLAADYSQIELRILAHMTHDPTLVEAFQRGEDIHAATAAEVLGVPIDQVTPNQRRLAKVVNFGVLYGMSEYGLAQRTGLATEEASRFIARYFERFATVRQFQEQIIREAERTGYASSLLGRRRYVPEIRSPVFAVRERARRELINQPIQSTAADIIKIAMIKVQRYLEEQQLHTKMILQVHDELLFEGPPDELERFTPTLRELMETALPLDVPIVVDVKVGPNWEDMTPVG